MMPNEQASLMTKTSFGGGGSGVDVMLVWC
jgi:hypothetical protein